MSDDHPLVTKNMQGAVAIVALTTSLGIALMSFHLLVPGIILAMSGFVGVLWIYSSDLAKLRLRSTVSDGTTVPLPGEITVVLLLLTAAFVGPWAIFIHEIWPERTVARHLTAEQKAIMRPILEGAPNYVIQINSVASCEECEDYAIELRQFFGSIRGWAVNGGPLIFPIDPQMRNGITFSPDVTRDDLAAIVTKAFDAAHIEIAKTIPEKLVAGMSALILVGKQSSS